MVDRHDALKPGTQLEGYRFGHVLGAGGFGITYYATDELLERAVAIKEFLPSGVAHRERDGTSVRPMSSSVAQDFAYGLTRFRDEARTLVNFKHPNIVPVMRYFEANGTGYLVMGFEKGQSLGQLLHPDKKLSEDELLEIAFPLLDGLKAIHARGFLHRDIKPDNIFIRSDGSPVLLDFGAARQALTERSQGMTAIVTPGYAPAEQYESNGDQGPWSDVYAMGGVMYRCIVGERPLEATARMSAHYRGRPDPMTPASQAAAPGVYSPATLAAIDAALAIDGVARPQSADAFAALLRGEAVPAAPAPAPAPSRFAARPPETATIVVGEPSGATRRPRRRAAWKWAAAAAFLLALTGGAYYGYAEYTASHQHQSADVKRQVDDHLTKAQAAIDAGRFDEAQRHLDDAAKLDSGAADLPAKRKSLEEARARADAKRRGDDDAKRRADDDAKRRAADDDAKRRADDDAKRRADEDAKRRADEDAARRVGEQIQNVRQRLGDARSALGSRRYADAKKAAEAARAAAEVIVGANPNSAEAAAALREARALAEDIARAATQYRSELLARAREAIQARRLDDAKRALDEAEQIEGGADIAALRRDYTAAAQRESSPEETDVAEAQRLVREILRKAQRGERENGFCQSTRWPQGTAEIFIQWLESASVGSARMATYKGGADCQYDRVTQVYQNDGRKCVRYEWTACQNGKNCARGVSNACKQADGTWQVK